MYKTIKKQYEKSLEKLQKLFHRIIKQKLVNKIISSLPSAIEENHEKSSWINIAELITSILGFAAYCVISPVLAEYQREKGIRIFSMIAIAVIIVIIIWELLCLAGCNRLQALGGFLCCSGQKVMVFCRKYLHPFMIIPGFLFSIFIIIIVFLGELAGVFFRWLQKAARHLAARHSWSIKWILLFLLVTIIGCLHFIPDVTCFKSITEIYGMPTGLGEELKETDLEKCAAYWKIEDYSWRNFMVLTYMEPYQQLEVMKENSSAYGMSLFQPTARIEIRYESNRKKYLSLNQRSFEAARNNKFREPKKISYYSSNDKLILQMEKNKYGSFDITRYSSADKPQLLNSTLFYTQSEGEEENDMTSRQIEVTYNADGLPETRRLCPYIYNTNGINGEYYVYDPNQRLTALYYLDINGEFVCNKQGIMMIDFQYEDNGNLHSIRYYGDEEKTNKTEGYQGVFCERFSYDSYGNLKERSQRDRNENLRSDVNGVCMYRYDYDDKTDFALTREEFFGFDGEPVRDDHFHSTCVAFSKSNNMENREIIVSLDQVGSSVTPVNAADSLQQPEVSAEMENLQNQSVPEPNDNQQQIPSDLLPDPQNSLSQAAIPTFMPQTGRQAIQTALLSQTDRQSDQTTFASQGQKISEQEKNSASENNARIYLEEEADTIRSYTSIRYVIDNVGCIAEKKYYKTKDKPVACKDGYAITRFEYDDQKRIICESYFDKNDNLCLNNNGYAVVRRQYESDWSDNLKSIEYLHTDKETLVQNKELGYATVTYERTYDDKNKTVRKTYFDENHDPVRLPGLGYSEVRELYDESNFLTSEAYYITGDQKTCRLDYGVAEIWYEYEESGNRIRELYKDMDKQLVNRSDTGYAAVYWQYESGQITDCHYEGSQNQMLTAAVDRKTGIAGIRYTYESGKKIREEYYDTDGMPSCRTDIGCAATAFEYNDRGQISTKSYYGLDGESVMRKDTGYAAVAYQDDEYGRRTSVRFYDTNKQLVISADDHCAGYDYEYDPDGNREYIKYIGPDERLMIRRDLGYAQVHYKYDSDGNIIEGRYLDADNNPAIRKERGYAYYTSVYDENGNWKESCYYIAEETPVLRQDTGYFRIENKYDTDGKLEYQKFYGIDGQQPVISTKYHCAGFEFTYDDIYDNEFNFQYDENEKGIRKTTTYIGLNGKPIIRKDLGYARVVSVYDIEDNAVSAVYYDADGNITVCKEGAFAAFRDKYENGKWVEGTCYGINGQPVLRSDTGYAATRNEYDEYGQRTKEIYYDENYAPVISTKYHCAGRIFEYDKKGNKTHVKFLNTADKIMMRRDLGYAQVALEYDSSGNQIAEAYFDTKGKPAVWKEGGYSSYRSVYDNVKWMESRYYDKKGKLTLRNDEGYAVIKNEYDEYGQRITQTYYDASDILKPIISTKYHCAGFQFEYDERGNKVYAGYLDMDGNLMTRRDFGFAQVAMKYDSLDRKTHEAYFDIWGNPAIDKTGGYSCYRNSYDSEGRRETVEYFIQKNVKYRIDMDYYKTGISAGNGTDSIDETDWEGELVLRKDKGYAKVEYIYDDFGQERFHLYYGTDDKPVISTEYFCSGFAYKYDDRGNQTDIYYLGLHWNPNLKRNRIVRRDLGIAHIQKEYDMAGNLTKELYFNHNGPATYKQYGYASYEETFKNGKVTETRYLDEKGHPVMHGEKGYAAVRYEYDIYGQRISESFYGLNNEEPVPALVPVTSKEDYCAGFQYEYDESGNQVGTHYIDTDGNPVIRRDRGYASVLSRYDECGNEIEASYYDTENRPVAWKDGGSISSEFIYDRGHCIERRYYDRQGHLMLRRDTGCAIIRYEYDDYGQNISESYYDTEGNPIFSKEHQCAERQFGYDEKGNQTDFCCIGLDGKPMIWGELGYAQIACEFDHFNNKTKETYLDTNGDPIVRQELGYAQTQWEYNDLGQVSKEAYFDAEGQATVCKDGGYAYCMFYYGSDDTGHWEEKQYFDTKGDMMLRKDEGYAIIQHFYDEYNQCSSINYFGLNRERIINSNSYCARITYEYDDHGNNTRIWYWDTNKKVAECKNTGIAMEKITYNKYGNIIERAYSKEHPTDDNLVTLGIHKELGYARVKYIHNGSTRIRTEYYDAEGNYIAPKGKNYAIYKRGYDRMLQVKWEVYCDANKKPVVPEVSR